MTGPTARPPHVRRSGTRRTSSPPIAARRATRATFVALALVARTVAADERTDPPAPALASDPPAPPRDARAAGQPPALSIHRVYVRAGVLHMAPHTRSSPVALAGVHGAASLAIADGPIAGSGATLDPVTTAAAILGYTLTPHLAVETVVGAPIHITFRATGTLADMSIAPEALGIPTGVPALGSELGEATAAPPLVTLVARPPVPLGPVHPYVGTGVAVLVAYGARATNPVLTAAAEPHFAIDPAVGWVLQTGLDVHLYRALSARLDIKYVAFLRAHATVDHIAVRTPDLPIFDRVSVGRATMDLTIDPLIVQAALGLDF